VDITHPSHPRYERDKSFGMAGAAGAAFFEVNALLKFRRHVALHDDAWHHAEVEYILGQDHRSVTDRILDVDCGRGGRVRALAARGFEQVTGLDPASDNLDSARATATGNALRASFVQGAPPHYPFPDGSFEEILILSARFGSGPASDIALLRETLRVLAPCGTLWFSVADGDWLRNYSDSQVVERSLPGSVVTEQSLTERLYGPCELTDVLYGLGFRAVSYRVHQAGFAAVHHDGRKNPARLLVRCRAPRPS
jgi:SAM-dependent methyltransferase